MYGLVFLLLTACKHPANKIELVWKGDQAVAIQIPIELLVDAAPLRIEKSIKVVRAGYKTDNGILGTYDVNGEVLVFRPLIPLVPGFSFDIMQDTRVIGKIVVPVNSHTTPPVLLAIYPQQDTLPENQLKLYLHFSKPMRTGQALEHITLLDKNKDTMQRVFLNLQPELWDSTGTTLTLWLDPGRIKRDLVLNRELGNPLKKSQSYQLVISADWKDTRGMNLFKTYTKNFTAGERDGQMPDINKWELVIPKAGTDEPLVIKTNEPLDHYLLTESVAVLDNKGKMLYSKNVSGDKDRILKITPLPPWKAGKYQLLVKARLEDLAGNNLNRVFDRDIRKDKQQNKEWFEREFVVK
jgi:hypothetical protein